MILLLQLAEVLLCLPSVAAMYSLLFAFSDVINFRDDEEDKKIDKKICH
jgi:hypothetical protein